MKTLKESILSRSSHSGEGFKAQRRELIESWLKEYDIEDYTIKDDFTIDINGGVDLVDRELKETTVDGQNHYEREYPYK